jgi:hypothetical protein
LFTLGEYWRQRRVKTTDLISLTPLEAVEMSKDPRNLCLLRGNPSLIDREGERQFGPWKKRRYTCLSRDSNLHTREKCKPLDGVTSSGMK